MSQCLGISIGQMGWEWSPVAGGRDEAQGGDRETIHSVDSASNGEDELINVHDFFQDSMSG